MKRLVLSSVYIFIKMIIYFPEPMIRVNLGWRDFGQYRR